MRAGAEDVSQRDCASETIPNGLFARSCVFKVDTLGEACASGGSGGAGSPFTFESWSAEM